MNHGSEITAEAVETTFGQQGAAGRFANFCNAVIVAEGIAPSVGVPVLSEKAGADGCFDGEWDVNLPAEQPSPNPFGLPGWNVFQFKSRGIIGGGKPKAVSSLKSGLKGALAELVVRLKRPKKPRQYVLFTNLHLGLESESTTKSGATLSQDRSNLEAAVRDGYDTPAGVQIVDAAQLAALVNKHPSLRLTYFSAPIARPWDEKWAEEQSAKNYKVEAPLIGREKEMTDLAKWVADECTKVIAISGPSGMGKTRLALEATRPDRFRTTVVDLVEDFESWGLVSLCTSPHARIIIVEDPDAAQTRRLAKQAVTASGVKLILTFPSEADAPSLKLTDDESIRLLVLKPLDRDRSRKLLTAAGANFDSKALDWVIQQAGGIPEILLSAAELGPRLRDKSGDLKAKLASEYRKRIETGLGGDAMQTFRLISPLQWVKVAGEENELPALLNTIGGGQTAPVVIDQLDRLEKMGYVRRRGEHASAVPPLFAAALAEDVLNTQLDSILALFDRIGDAARKRLLERTITTNVGEDSKFWDHVFDSALGTGERLLANLDFLGYLARAVPRRTARFLSEQVEDLKDVLTESDYNRQRSMLLSTFRELAYEPESCAEGMRLLQIVASNEPWEERAGSAAEKFCECFVHRYYSFPMAFQERERWLRRMLESSDPRERRLAARAVVMATAPPHTLSGYTVNARKLGSPPPRRLWQEVHDYLDQLLEIRFDLAQDTDRLIAEFAQDGFIHAFQQLRKHLPAERLVGSLEEFLGRHAAGKIKADERDVRQTLHWLEKKYIESSEAPNQTEYADKWMEILQKLKEFRRRFDQGPFATRLKITLGRAFDTEWEEIDGKRVYVFEKRCHVLAQETVANPELMTDEVWTLLKDSKSNQAPTFVRALGEFDVNCHFLDRFESSAGDRRNDINLGYYLAGHQIRDREFVDARLNDLLERSTFPRDALLMSMEITGPTQGNRIRLQTLLARKEVEPRALAQMVTGRRWLEDLPLTEVRTILEFIATGPAEWPKCMVRVLSLYLHADKALPHELIPVAERTLAKVDSLDDDLDWNCGQVAIGIGRADLDKGFGLLERQIAAMKSADWRGTWTPFHAYRSDEFWKFLRGENPERAYRELLGLRGSEDKSEIGLVLDVEKHNDILLKIAAESEANAAFFAGLVSGAQQGFFPFSYSLIQLFPASEAIRSSLSSAAVYQVGSGEFEFGSASDKFQQAAVAIEYELSNPSTPSKIIGWLEELKQRVQNARSSRRFRDNDEPDLGWD